MKHAKKRWVTAFITMSMLFSWAAYATDNDPVKVIKPLDDGSVLFVPKRDIQGVVDPIPSPTSVPDEYFESGSIGAFASFQIQTYRDALGNEELQFYFEITDNTDDPQDDIQLHLDLNHSHSVDTPDRELRITRNGEIQLGDINLFGPPADLPAADPVFEISDDGSTWRVEVKILPSQLGLNLIPDEFGMHIEVRNSGVATARYPDVPVSPQTDWENVETRFDVDYMIVLDRSGSMLSQDKWEDAKQAANIFANTMALLRNPDFSDQLGLVTFNWPCGNATTDETATAISLSSSFETMGFPFDYTAGLVDPLGSFCTPIGSGLAEAFMAGNLNANDDDETVGKKRGVLLLSDGLQNKPVSASDLDPNATGYANCNGGNFTSCTSSNVLVSTVAFGQGDGNVDTQLLADIRDHYAGTFSNEYQLATDKVELQQAFIQSLQDYYNANLITGTAIDASNGSDFAILDGNEKFIAIASWEPGMGEAIEVLLNGVPQACEIGGFDASMGFAACAIEQPGAGTLTVLADDGLFNAVPDEIFGVVDLRLLARFAMAPEQPETGEALLLTVHLQDLGEPVLHDVGNHPVDVRVRVEKPGESVGTFVSTTQPGTCDFLIPSLPPIKTDIQGQGSAGSVPLTQIPSTGTLAMQAAFGGQAINASAAQAVGDPDPPLFSTVKSLLRNCRQGDLLPRIDDPGLRLVDDGTMGDEVANDGIYSMLYEDTEVEGTYVFEFTVDGQTAAGEPFARTNRQATYVRIHADPEASVFGDRIIAQVGDIITKQHYILPKDQFNGYMGPEKAHKVDFVITSGNGTFINDVTDLGNGYYTRSIRYDASQGEPEVTPTVYGDPVVKVKKPLEIHLLAGGTFFDSDIALDNGLVVGARLGYGLSSHLVVEAEGAVTFTEVASISGKAIQLFGNLRYDFNPNDDLVFFLTAGAGYILIRDFVADDEAFAYHGGGGLTYWLSNKFGLRGDFRVINVEPLFNATNTTNFQATGALVFKL